MGWWFGWTSFAFLTIVTVSVDYGLIQVAFQPLIGETYTPTSAALETLVVLALQAALIITSTRVTTRVNNTAVATEIIGIVGLTVAAAHRRRRPGARPLVQPADTGPVPAVGYYAWLGPFMLATLLGAYTIVGFESASNLAEETHEPHKVIPRAMVRAVLLSGVVGFVFLLVLAFATDKGAYSSSAPVAYIVGAVLGSVVQKIFLVFVVVSIFACGLVIMVTNGRLIFSMARDRRLPGHQFLTRCRGPPAARPGPPSWPPRSAASSCSSCSHTNALFTLFTASTIMPALLYAGTVLLYIATRRGQRRNTTAVGEWPVIAGAVIWLAYELIVLIGPGAFRDAQYYVLGALGLGLVFYIVQLVTEPAAMRAEPGVRSEHPRHRPGHVGDEGPAGRPGQRDARPGGGPGAHPRVGGDGVEADPEELWGSVVSAGARALAAARAAARRSRARRRARQPGRDGARLGQGAAGGR